MMNTNFAHWFNFKWGSNQAAHNTTENQPTNPNEGARPHLRLRDKVVQFAQRARQTEANELANGVWF